MLHNYDVVDHNVVVMTLTFVSALLNVTMKPLRQIAMTALLLSSVHL